MKHKNKIIILLLAIVFFNCGSNNDEVASIDYLTPLIGTWTWVNSNTTIAKIQASIAHLNVEILILTSVFN